MNWTAIKSIYIFEMTRFFRTFLQSLISPVLSTSLYFVVFGAAIGSRINEVEGVSYAAFIVPGLIMLSVMTQGISNGSFGIYFPKFIGTIYELLSVFGFIIGIWAKNFEQLQLVPLLIVTPLVFLGGSFYSISMLPPVWQAISMFNPVVYLISGFRWAFFGIADVPIGTSLLAIAGFTGLCLLVIGWIFRTGWRIRE